MDASKEFVAMPVKNNQPNKAAATSSLLLKPLEPSRLDIGFNSIFFSQATDPNIIAAKTRYEKIVFFIYILLFIVIIK